MGSLSVLLLMVLSILGVPARSAEDNLDRKGKPDLHLPMPSSPRSKEFSTAPMVVSETNSLISKSFDVVMNSLEWGLESVGMEEICPFASGKATLIPTELGRYVKAQQEGLRVVSDAIEAWEFSRHARGEFGTSDISSALSPLVLAFTGPTGVGKSETAYRLARALLPKVQGATNNKKWPNGLLILRGEDYSSSSEIGKNGAAAVRQKITTKLAELYRSCNAALLQAPSDAYNYFWGTGSGASRIAPAQSLPRGKGNGIVVFDEVQKVIPGGLDFITSLLDNGGTLEHGGVKYSVSNTIFILISDVGMDRMIKILLSSPSRAEIPLQDLRNEVKEALDAQWTNMGLGKFVSEVVPFLPLNKMGLEQVFDSKLFSDIHQLVVANKLWAKDLVVERRVVSYLVSPHFVKYRNFSRIEPTKKTSRHEIYAASGARSLMNAGPLLDLQKIISRHVARGPYYPDLVLYIDGAPRRERNDGSTARHIDLAWCHPSLFDNDMRAASISIGSVMYDSDSPQARDVIQKLAIEVDVDADGSVSKGNSEAFCLKDLCDIFWTGPLH